MFSFSIIQIFNNSKSSVLSLQSSRSRRRQFSTTTTVRVLQYPQAARCNININIKISSISKSLQYQSLFNIKISTISNCAICTSIEVQYQNLYNTHDVHNIFNKKSQQWCTWTYLQVDRQLNAMMSENSIDFTSKFARLAKHVTDQDQSWFSATSKSDPPSLEGMPSMSLTRISLGFLPPPSQNIYWQRQFPLQSWFEW